MRETSGQAGERPPGAWWTTVCNQKKSGGEKKTTFCLVPEQTSGVHH